MSRYYIKRQFCLLLVILFPWYCFAQKHGQVFIDSVVQQLPAAKEDTNKVLELLAIGKEYMNINTDEGINYSKQGLQLSEQLGWKRGISGAYNFLAILNYQKSDYATALDYNFKSLKISEETGDKKGQAKIFLNIGNIYHDQKEYAKSIDHFLGAIKKFEQINDKRGVAYSDLGLGNVYNEQNDFPAALQYFFSSIKIFEELRDSNSIGKAYCNVGNVYQNQGNYTEALKSDLLALKMQQAAGNDRGVAADLGNIGEIYLTMVKDTGKMRQTGNRKNNLTQAIVYLQKGIEACQKINYVNAIIEYKKFLSEAYALSGDDKKALAAYKEYTTLQDSIFSTSNKINIAHQETKRENDLKEKQIELNLVLENQKKNERFFYLLGIAILFLIIGIVWRNFTKQKRTNDLLEKERAKSNNLMANLEELVRAKDEVLQQKDMLMKEIHHRVKNNLQVISTLLDLQLENINDTKARKALTEGMSRIKSISLIHQQLYQNEDIASIEFSKFTNDLLKQVTTVFKKPGQTISIVNKIPETFLDIDTAVPLGLILNELITNSYKYAFYNNEGSISVDLVNEMEYYKLIYKDSGPGLPADYDMSSSNTIGIMVMDSLSNQLGGNFTFDRVNKEFIITFKDITERKKIA